MSLSVSGRFDTPGGVGSRSRALTILERVAEETIDAQQREEGSTVDFDRNDRAAHGAGDPTRRKGNSPPRAHGDDQLIDCSPVQAVSAAEA